MFVNSLPTIHGVSLEHIIVQLTVQLIHLSGGTISKTTRSQVTLVNEGASCIKHTIEEVTRGEFQDI